MTALSARRLALTAFAVICCGTLLAATGYAQQPDQQGEFLPIDQLPPTDPFPAAPLLIAAYTFVIVGVFLYVVSVARRLTVVQREVERLEADVKRAGRT